jgi:hypothetical protein
MADDPKSRFAAQLERLTGRHSTGTAGQAHGKIDEASFPGEFARLKATVIRPVFEAIGNTLQERGDEVHVSEEAGGRISIHIIPAGTRKSIHPHDWFPTLSFFGAPIACTIGLHGRNMRPNLEVASGSRGIFAPAQINQDMVKKELMKFIGEIANW